jgi:hypothetical protein
MKWNFLIFFLKIMKGGEFTKLGPETESRNGGDHKFWIHELRGSPVYRLYSKTLAGLEKIVLCEICTVVLE